MDAGALGLKPACARTTTVFYRRARTFVLDRFKVDATQPLGSFLLTGSPGGIYVGRHTSLVWAGNLMLRTFSGACVRRVIDPSHACVPEHAHDWPVLSLYVIGSYLNETEVGQRFICGPSAVFYRAGASHRNTIAAVGFEQIEIEFDPDWLGCQLLPSAPVTRWIGARAGREARDVARACESGVSATQLRAALQRFLEVARCQPHGEPPSWIGTMTRRLGEDTTLSINDLAREAGRHPSWVGAAYRQATGEGLQETAARFRVERAVRLLRETVDPYASIAVDAGFCDQSHMNRTFRRVLGRAPGAVREERREFRQKPSPV
jgi:AraC-like DNA-binding protein